LLQRYGIVTREVALAENVRGGFSAIYPVLKAMEESGRLRRGYFIAGQGAAQFAEAGAEEQLRLHRARAGDAPSREAFAEGDAADGAPSAWVLSSVDPANAYGALVPWPPRAVDAANEGEGERVGTVSRLQRHGAARVILQDGRLLGYLGRTQGSLVSFVPTDEPDRSRALEALAASLAGLVSDKGKRVLLLRSIDGAPPGDSPLAPYLRQVGFRLGAAGFLKEGRSEHA
jgi:ATP-dependent Lhr-like helicase